VRLKSSSCWSLDASQVVRGREISHHVTCLSFRSAGVKLGVPSLTAFVQA